MIEFDVLSISSMSSISMFFIGLLGAGHCAGMCGGIVAALSFNTSGFKTNDFKTSSFATDSSLINSTSTRSSAEKHRKSPWPIILTYNLGRIASYGLMGALVGQLGYLGGQYLSLGPWLRGIAGLLLILMGFYIADWWRVLTLLESAGQYFWQRLQPISKGLFKVHSIGKVFLFGLLWGWLPCGLVYSALAYAGTSATPISGALSMMAFGLGTLPTMVLGGLFAAQLQNFLQGRILRVMMALILITFGSWTIWTAVSHSHVSQHGNSQHSSSQYNHSSQGQYHEHSHH